MKRTKFAAALAVLTLLTTLTGCGQAKEADGALEPVTLNEVAHSIFYAPQYAAIELGYFKDEGIALTLVNGAGADKVMTSLISGDADIGFMGSEASIYVYQEGSADYAVNFAQLTQRAGNFLVGRSAEPDFSWQDLKGKKVLGGRAGGMPEMVFEYILKKNGIDPKNDLTIDQSINFGLTAAAFTSNDADYTVEVWAIHLTVFYIQVAVSAGNFATDDYTSMSFLHIATAYNDVLAGNTPFTSVLVTSGLDGNTVISGIEGTVLYQYIFARFGVAAIAIGTAIINVYTAYGETFAE